MEQGQVDPKFVQLAERVDIFKGLRPGDVQKIFSKGMTQSVNKGDVLFHKGTVGNLMYVVLDGKVGVFDGENQLATHSVGDTFGEMSLLTGAARSATVMALESSSLFALSEDVFQKLLTKRVAVQMLMNMSRMLAKRLNESNVRAREREGK